MVVIVVLALSCAGGFAARRWLRTDSDEVEVASGAYGVQALGAATVGETTALAWQQDGSDGQGMVAVAFITCR